MVNISSFNFQVFQYYWRYWYKNLSTGYGVLLIWDKDFDCSVVDKDLRSINKVTHDYLRLCCTVQQKNLKELSSTASSQIKVDSQRFL